MRNLLAVAALVIGMLAAQSAHLAWVLVVGVVLFFVFARNAPKKKTSRSRRRD